MRNIAYAFDAYDHEMARRTELVIALLLNA